MEIKVFGPGCAKCKKTTEIVKQAVEEAGLRAEVIKVTDLLEIGKAGVFGTPAVMVDGEVKIVGKIPGKKDVLDWIKK